MRRTLSAALSVAAICEPSAAQSYDVIELPGLEQPGTYAYDISEAGRIAGRATGDDGWFRAVTWDSDLVLHQLPLLAGFFAEAYAVNDQGETTGQANLVDRSHAFRHVDDVMHDLGTLGDDNSVGFAINDLGQIAGSSGVDPIAVHACLWLADNTPVDLGTFGGTYSEATDINNLGQVCGWASIDDNNEHAFLWDPTDGMLDLGTITGRFSYANALNVHGHVVGFSSAPRQEEHAFFWTPESGMQDLGVLGPGDTSMALGINAHDQVVGWTDTGDNLLHAMIWDDENGMRDLNELIPDGTGWTLVAANDVNDSGRIVGYGWRIDSFRAFLLVPICAGDWNDDDLVNTIDFIDYLGDYVAVLNGDDPAFGDPDLAEPFGELNTADFIEFLNRFTAGCD